MSSAVLQQPEAEAIQNQPDSNEALVPDRKELLLSSYLDADFAKRLVEMLTSAYTNGKRVFGLREFFEALIADKEVLQYNAEAKVVVNDVLATLPATKENENQNQGMIIIDPEVKGRILDAIALGIRHNDTLITPLKIWKTFLQKEADKKTNAIKEEMPILSKFFSKLEITANEKIIGRDVEVNSLMRILMKQEKQNVLLIGDYGIGKTAIVKKMMQSLQSANSLSDMKEYQVLVVQGSEFINYIKYQIDETADELSEIAKVEHKIFYFPNLDLEPIGREPIVIEFMLNAFLKNPSNRMIIACSVATYQKIVSKVNLFAKHFEMINVAEPPQGELVEIINTKLTTYSQSGGFTFNNEFSTDLIDYSKRFIPLKVFPHKALNLLDEVVVDAKLHQRSAVTSEDLKMVLSQKTGIPIQSLGVGEKASLLQLEEKLNQVVIGQQVAVKSVVQSIQRSRVGLKNPNHPTGSFLFLGPSGVGKTEFAKQLAKVYFNDEKAFMRFDMSEYSEAQASQKLIGAPPGFAGYDEGGTLTNYVMQHPYSLLLFDEVEKADALIYDLFLQILDDGRLTDSKGNLVDFKNTIIIFTSNIGSDKIVTNAVNPASSLFSDPKSFFDNEIFPLLSKFMRVEFINRFDMIIPFFPLSAPDIEKILMLKLERIRDAVARQGYKIEFDSAGLRELAKLAYDPKFGAREIERVLNSKVENQVTETLLKNELKQGDTIYWKFQA